MEFRNRLHPRRNGSRTGSLILLASVAALTISSWSCAHADPRRGKIREKQPGTTARLPAVDPNSIGPGTVIELQDGTYGEALILPFKGTADRPVVIKAAKGARPTFRLPIMFVGAEHVVIEGLRVTGSPHPGIVLKQATRNVTVRDCTVERCGMGLWITEGAGGGNRIVGNTFRDNRTHGIGVDRVNASRGNETVIARNVLSGNGHHGIELNGSWYIVEENTAFENGAKSPGTTGIHVFAKDASEDAGDDNIIRYNVTYRNIETDGPDGNGIQLDQWCDRNQIYYNVAFDNDGAGICLFDSRGNLVFNNTLYNNGRGAGKNRPYRAEILLAGDEKVNGTRDNTLFNNIAVSSRPGVVPLLLDGRTAANPQVIERNLFHHAGGGNLYSWAGTVGTDLAELERLAGPRAADNEATDPLFVSARPAAAADFGLKSGSKALKAGKRDKAVGPRDAVGNPVPAGAPDLGAVQSSK